MIGTLPAGLRCVAPPNARVRGGQGRCHFARRASQRACREESRELISRLSCQQPVGNERRGGSGDAEQRGHSSRCDALARLEWGHWRFPVVRASSYVTGESFSIDGGGLAGGIAPTGYAMSEAEVSRG